MYPLQIDLTNCDRELIHIPAQIQSHGFLIVLGDECIIRFCSDNLGNFIAGATDNLIGQPLSRLELLLKNKKQPNFITQLIAFGKADENFYKKNPFNLNISGVPFYLVLSKSAMYHLLEFEPATSNDFADVQNMIGSSISALLSAKKLDKLVNNSVTQVKNIINYDRVMIYRFDDDGHGEVIAEARNAELPPWLGLHYPASDIPKQARELYKLNLTRIIANVNSPVSKIIKEGDNKEPLDLTYSQLRAVSPMHIQYLKNMGVASSFSISLLHRGELWGLIACHNYTPRFIDYKVRESAKLIGQILSSALEFMENEENHELQNLYDARLIDLNHYLLKSVSIENALTAGPVTMLDIADASGAVLLYEKNLLKLGVTPNNNEVLGLIDWVQQNVKDPVYQTTNLSAAYPAAAAFKDVASGMMLFTISKELKEYAIWFKPELIKTVSWAGNPHKPVVVKNGVDNLSPRQSFETWKQTVMGTSEPWTHEETRSVTRLREELLYAVNIKAGAIRILNEKLKQAYEELDTFSYTLSHDLKNPIAAIKGYSEMLLMNPALESNMQKALRRICERANKMNSMVNDILDYTHLTRLDTQYKNLNAAAMIKEIITDLDDFKGNVQITVGHLPDIYGDTVMVTQVFNNLISNAVKYSVHANPGMIHIEGKVQENDICYSIKDNGIGIAPENMTLIYGLFKRMSNVQKIDGSGVGLAIVKRIIDKHSGKIWAESELGKGSTFYVCFNKESVVA